MMRLTRPTLILAALLLPLSFGGTLSVQGMTGKAPAKELSFQQRRRAKTTRRAQSRNRAEKSEEDSKPSPLLLVLRVTEDRRIFLNADEHGTLDDSSVLISGLLKLFAVRKDQRAYKIGMELRTDLPESERIEKQVYFQPHPTLKDEEVSRLLEEIKETGADPVIALSEEEYEQKFGWLFEPETYGWWPPWEKKTPLGKKIIDGGVLNGKALSLPKPPFPASARAAQLSGTVAVRLIIDERGKVISVLVVSGPALLQAAAVDAARQATFAPTILLGRPVGVRGVINYTFVGK